MLTEDQYPDEDEEFELQYQQELELVEDCENEEVIINSNGQTKHQMVVTEQRDSSLLQSPQLSQIPSAAKRLFSSQHSIIPLRGCSTPAAPNKRKDFIEGLGPLTPISSSELIHDEIQNLGKRNKRRLEKELFGDIDDLYGYESYQDPIAKKARSEEERDLEAIEKILGARKNLKDSNQFQVKDNLSRLQALHDFKMRNLSYTIPNWPFLPLVRSDEQRIYCRFHSEEYEERALNEINLFKSIGSLLGENKQEVWNTANDIVLKRISSRSTQEEEETPQRSVSETISGDLWVEKYKPKKYIDLLSDENTNRNLLYWLKMWDKVVFRREFNLKPRETDLGKLNSFNKRTGRFESTGGWYKQRARGVLETKLDDLGRPMQKIALLCGPPGLGKTTLAHTIAAHAGYEVREVNASDDRTPEAFKLALENGTQMSSVLNENRRPNCIILDEIDGAPKQSIDFLVKFATDSYVSKVQSKTTKTKRNILKRPIICICNDLYDPALRALRQIAFVVTVPSIESSRLAERLVQIAKIEKLKTDFGALIALAEKSGNDVRSCISTMQFFNAQKNALTLQDVLNNKLGKKDRHQGLFEVWSAIFRIQRPRKQLVECMQGGKNSFEIGMTDTSTSTRVNNVLEAIHSSGDYERLMQGVYENYLHQKMPDPNLNGVVEAAQWFTFSDILNQQINHIQNYTVYPYLQYGFVVWHLMFATLAWPKINFPTKGFEFNQKSTALKNIFQALTRGIKSESVGVGQGHFLLTETVPLLKNILSLQIRSVDVQLLSKRERDNLKHCVDVMVDLGLTYTQVKTSEGNYQFQFEPDIELLNQFHGYDGMRMPNFARQILAREVELENIRRSRPKITKQSLNTTIKKPANHLQTLKAKTIGNEIKDVVTKDFFGRIQDKMSLQDRQDEKSDPIVKSPIWYRYKEGFNNAVRKDIHLNDLL